MSVEYYKQVPDKYKENLAYRLKLRKRSAESQQFRDSMWKACQEDVLFFFASFCFLFEPRPRIVDGKRLPRIIPFIPWAHQIPVIKDIKASLGRSDIGLEKARGEGASWILVLLALHDWLFSPMAAIGLISKDEDSLDTPDNLNTLFGKIDWELKQLPDWMSGVQNVDWKRNKTKHTFDNLRNNANITGYSSTGDAASGGRTEWFGMDELSKFPKPSDTEVMASTQQITESRFFVSTPKGSTGAYYELMHEPSNMVRLVLDWKDNPYRNRGMYRMRGANPVAIDPNTNPLPPEYDPPSAEIRALFTRLRRKGFNLSGCDRSPWYDKECDRPGATPQSIAQELDRDYGGSMFHIFGETFANKVAATVKGPLIRANISYHPEKLEPLYDQADDGECFIWCPLDNKDRPPQHQYVIGCDVASGLGGSYTSNSALVVVDLLSREQVFEFASNIIEPQDFADFAIAVAKWFHGAYLAWEHNGPGTGFSRRVLDKKYKSIYYRTVLWKLGRKKNKEVGWWTDERSKETLFADFNMGVRQDEFVVRSRALKEECDQYTRNEGKIVHSQALATQDQSAKGAQHGDRVIAAAVCLQAMKDRPMSQLPQAEEDYESMADPPPNTLAWRMRQWEKEQALDSDPWDHRDTSDLLGTLHDCRRSP